MGKEAMMKVGDVIDGMEVISVYTRAEALEDGVLVDVSETAKESGFVFPVAMTIAAWERYIKPSEQALKIGQSETGRLWDMCWMLRHAIRRAEGGVLLFKFLVNFGQRTSMVELKSHCGPGDNGEPVITIMLPQED